MTLRRTSRTLNTLLLTLPTIGLLFAALFATLHWRYPHGLSPSSLSAHITLFSFIIIAWMGLYYGFGLLDFAALRKPNQLIRALVGAHTVGLAVAVFIFYIQPTLFLTPRRFLLVDTAFAFSFSLAWQLLIRTLLRQRTKPTVYLIDLENAYRETHQDLLRAGQSHIEQLSSSGLATFLSQHQSNVPHLFVVPSGHSFSPDALAHINTLRTRGATFMTFEDFYEETFRRVYTAHISDLWILEHVRRPIFGLYPVLKRFFDVLLALILGFVWLVTFPLIAVLIFLSDRQGSIFFRQTRLSVNGTPFTIYKYRTMRAGTATDTWTHGRDSRVTRIGQLLRTTRLDELPQWLNILRGDMSFIGPRPEQANIVEQIKNEIPYFESRHAIRPGLIGWAQLHVYAANVEESRVKLQYDLYYIKHQSFFFDLEILLKTIAHVFFLNGI